MCDRRECVKIEYASATVSAALTGRRTVVSALLHRRLFFSQIRTKFVTVLIQELVIFVVVYCSL